MINFGEGFSGCHSGKVMEDLLHASLMRHGFFFVTMEFTFL